jgi:rRNA maturation endonuclease Nob1
MLRELPNRYMCTHCTYVTDNKPEWCPQCGTNHQIAVLDIPWKHISYPNIESYDFFMYHCNYCGTPDVPRGDICYSCGVRN